LSAVYRPVKIITLELPKLPEAPDAQKVWSWAKFFRVKTREELEAASAAAKGNRGLEMAAAEYKKLTRSERRRMIAAGQNGHTARCLERRPGGRRSYR
jgi:hypothetical protein